MLTLYIIPGGKTSRENFLRSAQSWGGEYVSAVHVVHGPFDKLKPATKWKAFIYSNEELSEGVKDVLGEFLESNDWDFFTLYRKSLDEKVSQAPRIYLSGVELLEGAPYPKDPDVLRGTWILNGWIVEQT